jgi:hypothetical protein
MAIYPGAGASDSNLYIAVNATSTQLTDNPLSNSATTVNVTDATAFPTVGFISIDNEIISYTGKTGTSFTGCGRGADGTTAASHVQNSQVFHNVIAAHHNALKDEVIAVEVDLVGVQSALTPTTPLSTATSILNRLNQIVQRFKDFTGLTNWYDTFTSFPVSKGGTGNTTLTSGAYLKGAGTGAVTTQAAPIPIADGGTNSITALANGKLLASAAGALQEISADASANSHKITDVANATAVQDAVAFGQLQVKKWAMNGTTSAFTTTSNTYQTSNLSISFTPTSASSTIIIIAIGQLRSNATQTSDVLASLFEGTTDLSATVRGLSSGTVTGNNIVPVTLMKQVSAGSTSTRTYSVKIKNQDNTTTVGFGNSTDNQQILVFEVA